MATQYFQKGSLDDLLHPKEPTQPQGALLTAEQFQKIVVGIAEGLVYFHKYVF